MELSSGGPPALLLSNGKEDRNMCSLNSILQLLRMVPDFLVELEAWGQVSPLLNSLHSTLRKCGTGETVSALSVRHHLAHATQRPLNSGAQQDTLELFSYLLEHCPNQIFVFETSF